MKRTFLTIALAAALATSLSADAALSKAAALPKTDGTFAAKEYQYDETMNGMRIGATLGSDDMLYLAIEAPTKGWVGLGVGGLVMNGSRLFFGAIQGGKPAFVEKLGKGHFYTDAKDLVVKSWSVKTAGDKTTLELSLPSSAALWKGKINATFAYSESPKFDSRHSERGSVSFAVK
jgi:hypothetical protein